MDAVTIFLATIRAWTNSSPDYATIEPRTLPATTIDAVPAVASVGTLVPGDIVLVAAQHGAYYIIGKYA